MARNEKESILKSGETRSLKGTFGAYDQKIGL
jgi:hypothetical protein